jgi:hypothetical protein
MYKKIVTFGRNNYKTMKKFAFIIFIFLPILTFAQNKNHFGIKAGFISTRLNTSDFKSNLGYSPRNLFTVGVAYNRNLNNILDIQIEALYSMKGYKKTALDIVINNSSTKQSVKYAYNADCVELPILLKLHTNKGKLKPFLNGGFAPSFNVGDQYNTFKPFDIGLVGSIGLDFYLSEKTYTFLEFRGNLGLLKTHTPIASKSDYSTSSLYLITGLFF